VDTCERVAEVIRREFGVRYHPAHVSRLLAKLGLSLRKPQRLADQSGMKRPSSVGKKDAGPSRKKGPRGGQDDSVC
jgi:transposase